MKPKWNLRSFLAFASSSLLAISFSHAATLYWDVNGTATGFSTVVGGWNGTNAFWNDQPTGTGGTPVAVTANNDDLNIVAATTNTGTITVTGTPVARSLTYGSTVGAVTISGGTSLTLGDGTSGGITVNSGAGAQTISTPLILSGANTSTNNSANTLSYGALNLNGNALTFSGSGTHTFSGSAANVISGAGGIVKNGSGALILDQGAPNAVHTFTGGITVNGGTITQQTGTNLTGRGNVTVNGGILGMRFSSNITFAGGLGTGATAIQILGGTSGFSGEGANTSTVTIGTSGSVLKWGASGENSASGFFNPAVLVLGGDVNMNTNAKGTLANGIDLNGTNRTITSLHSNGDGASSTGFTVSGTIINTAATPAGLEKTGPGNVILSSTGNIYNGATTITGGSLTVGNSGSLGNASATNTLIFNGGTLLASAAFNSANTRAVTMTTTGIINTNNFSVGILGNIDGAGGLTKNGAGTLSLSGTNTFGGVTTVNAGILAVTRESALANNTAANLNVKSGATLQLNVDSAGTAGFTSANLNTLLSNISVANSAAQGLQAGAIVALDTSTATGGIFTQGNAITNSTGSAGGVINIIKLGTGTLVFDKANTYTGLTTISAGTLRIDAGGSIAGPLVNNGVLLVNKSGTQAPGTDFPALIGGTGSIAVGAGGTINYSSPPSLLQNVAIDTTGGGTFNLGAVTTPVFGGLSGASGNLATVLTGYDSVTNLTLNVPSGSTYTYAGAIANNTANLSVTKTGAGTQVLTGTGNSYTGTTFLNAGVLQLGDGTATGRITGTAGLTFNGGTLTFRMPGANSDFDAIPNGAPVTVNVSSTFNVTTTNAGGAANNETVGAVTLNAGQMNFNWTNGGSSGTQMTLSSLSRSGTASANFNSGAASNSSRWMISGGATTAANQIIGPWFTTGGNNAAFASTDYASYNRTGGTSNTLGMQGAGIAGTAETTWTTAANAYTNSLASQTLTGTRTITALRNIGATATLTLATGNNLETYGVLNGVSTLFTIAPGTGGVLTTPTGGGNLFINAGAGAITVSAPINNNSGNVTLVKNGSATLTLSSTSSNFSGGIVLNAGALSFNNAAALNSNNITVNGAPRLEVGDSSNQSISSAITLNAGSVLTFGANGGSITINGAVTGDGSIVSDRVGSSGSTNLLASTANTFTGTISFTAGATMTLRVASLADSASLGAGNIRFAASSSNQTFALDALAIAPVTLNNRQIEFVTAPATTAIIANNSSQALTINSDLLVTATSGTRTLELGGTGAGLSSFNGKIDNGLLTSLSLTKTGTGTWNVSGNNSYTGTTSVSAGNATFSGNNTLTGQITVSGSASVTLSGNNSAMTSPVTLSTATATVGSSPLLNINSATALGTGTLTFGGGAATDVVRIDNSSAGAVAVSTANPITLNRNFTFVGTQSLNLGNGTTTIGGITAPGARIITVSANTLTFGGPITETVAGLGITKQGTGSLTLSSANNSFSGSVTLTGGTTNITKLADSGSNSSLGTGSSSSAIRFNGGTMNYTGTGGDTTNRAIEMVSSAAINNNGSGGIAFTATNVTQTGTASARTLTLGGNNTGGANTLASIIGNSGTGANITSLVKNGSSTWILSGVNTYTGNTTVSAGTLSVTGSIGATAVSVNAGTLSGNGNFGGNVSIASGATHAIAVAATPGAQDTSAITGTLTLTAGNILNLSAASPPASGEYVLATATTISGTPTTINYNGINGTVTVDTVSSPQRLLLTVSGDDTTPPTLTSINDNVSGGPVDINTPITFTVTFSEDINASTVSDLDFGNAGTAPITIGAITETSPGVFTVVVTPTNSGSVQLRINQGAVIEDTATIPNALVTTSALLDNTTITVRTIYESWANTNGATGGKAGDPDGDGYNNLMEFAFDTNPTTNSAASIAYSGGVVTAHGQPILVQESGTYYAVFGRRVNYVAAGLVYTVEFSAGLDQWTSSATGLTNVATDGVIDAVRVPFPSLVPTPSGPKKPTFFRVVISEQ